MKRLIAFAAVALTCAAFGHGGKVVTWTVNYSDPTRGWLYYPDTYNYDWSAVFCGDECVAFYNRNGPISKESGISRGYQSIFTFYREPMRVYTIKTTCPLYGWEYYTDQLGREVFLCWGFTYPITVQPDDDTTYWMPDYYTNGGNQYIFYNVTDGPWYETPIPRQEWNAKMKAEYTVSERAKKLLAEHTRGTMFTLQ